MRKDYLIAEEDWTGCGGGEGWDVKKKTYTKEQLRKKYNTTRKVILAGFVTFITSVVITLGSGAYGTIDNIVFACKNDTLDSQLDYLRKGQAYVETVGAKTDELYTQLKNGEISPAQFESKYHNAHSDEEFIKWARGLDNAEVQQIIADYDKKVEELDKRREFALAGVITGASCAAGSLIAMDVADKKQKKYMEMGRELNR